MDLRKLLEADLAEAKVFPEIFLCIGKKDFLYEAVSRFHKYLDEKNVIHRYDEKPEYEHEWAFWDLELPLFLDWLPRSDAYAGMEPHKM